MKTKKTINQLTNEELNKLIESSPAIQQDEPTFVYYNDALEFVSFYNLRPGPERVQLKLLFKLYRYWSQTPMTRLKFSYEMTDLFQYNSYGNGKSVVCLDKSSKKIKVAMSQFFKKQDRTKMKGYKKHFDTFLNFYKITSGSFYIKDTVLYDLYDKWVYKNHNKKPLNFRNFLSFVKLYFKESEKYIGGNYYFSIDATIINHLSDENINEMKKRYHEKEKKQKITKQIPRS